MLALHCPGNARDAQGPQREGRERRDAILAAADEVFAGFADVLARLRPPAGT
jgi:hypothetical protein